MTTRSSSFIIFTGIGTEGTWTAPTTVTAVSIVDPSSDMAVVFDQSRNLVFVKTNPQIFQYYADTL
jgi:hypothetical protein